DVRCARDTNRSQPLQPVNNILIVIIVSSHIFDCFFDILYSFDYSCSMYSMKWTPDFERWINRLRDRPTRIRLLRRLEKAQRGLLGDVNSIGEGVYEMREFFGPGWRMYYMQRGDQLIVMLGGGGKNTQSDDIKAAKQLATQIKEKHNAPE
ncbi:type II toxin-antitoxin system RelE/ParE family toxin, partial [Desulfurivibrio dismutans]|uniref:type II toxin-antitoxin system RelE/ParE family toxin n=1 Tax=Desulfurivibrio dismutans TaxID=1398908 RepID=UPI0023DB96EC